MIYAELENKIRHLDEQENEGQWTYQLARETGEAKSSLKKLLYRRNQIDNQKAK